MTQQPMNDRSWCDGYPYVLFSLYVLQPYDVPGYSHFLPSHIRSVLVWLGVTSHLHFWQNDRDFFTCYCSNTGMDRIPNRSQYSILTLEKKLSRFSCREYRISSPVLLPRPFALCVLAFLLIMAQFTDVFPPEYSPVLFVKEQAFLYGSC